MTETTALAVRPEEVLALALADQSKLAVLRETIAQDLTAPEFDLFVEVARATGLNPFMKQIYAIARGRDKNRKVTFQTGIDGFRLLAVRTGQYDGQDEPLWCGDDGNWRDVWTSKEPPFAARVSVYRKDSSRAFVGIARYSEYVQMTRDYNSGDSKPNEMWSRMPVNQLAKCAEALALRKAFPAEMSGVYSDDEMGQADNEPKDVTPAVSENRKAAREALRTGTAQAETQAQAREQAAAAPAGEDAEAKREKMLQALDPWAQDVYLFLERAERKMGELSAVLGGPVTKNNLRAWAAALPEGADPFDEMTAAWSRTLEPDPLPAPEVVEGEVVSETPALVETASGLVDPSTGEIVDDEGDASQFTDDEAFE